MRRDLKIGMLLGVGAVICATVALSLWPGVSVEERMRRNLPDSGSLVPFGLSDKSIAVKPGNIIIPQDPPAEPVDVRIPHPPSDPVKPKPTGVQPSPRPEATEKPKPAQRIHVAAENETLSRISQQYYGTSSRWQAILQANSTVLKAPEQLRPGMRLVIPDVTEKPDRSSDR